MTLIVAAIGLAHGIPPALGGFSGGKVGVVLGCFIALLIAFWSGSGQYLAFDIVGVLIGTWLGWTIAKRKSSPR